MAFEDIERLKEKVEKDPKSKLFIPLSEEYKKAGMFDEAIDVLINGLERQPDYMSARVALGKIYFERGMSEEAKAEFEKVISAIPDNLYAHKKLAEIYRDIGERDKAIKEFKTLLKLNPMDEWAASNLTDIAKKPQLPKKAKEPVSVQPEEIKEAGLEEPEEIPLGEEITEEIEKAFPDTGEEVIEDIEEALPEEGEEVLQAIEETAPEISEDVLEDIEPLPEEAVKAEGAEEELMPEIGEISEEDLQLGEEYGVSEAVADEKEIAFKKEEITERPSLSINDADVCISQEKYPEAINIYRRILMEDPDNLNVMQRLEELKFLLKLLGKDKEVLISRLESLLGSIKKRRNEFFGRT
jgi:tetratricopeptide (TPR) repeat protein